MSPRVIHLRLAFGVRQNSSVGESGDAAPLAPKGWIARVWSTWWGKILAVLTGLGAALAVVNGGFELVGNIVGEPPTTADPVATAPPGVDAIPSPGVPVDSGTEDGECAKGYWPERPMFDVDEMAPYAAINALTGHPWVGDTRNFVRVRNITTDGTSNDNALRKTTSASLGDEVEIAVWVINSADDELDSSAATLHGLTLHLCVPQLAVDDLTVRGTLSAINATSVEDAATVVTASPALLELVSGSATFESGAGGYSLSDGIASGDDVLLGWDQPDGDLPVGWADDGRYRAWGFVKVRFVISPPE